MAEILPRPQWFNDKVKVLIKSSWPCWVNQTHCLRDEISCYQTETKPSKAQTVSMFIVRSNISCTIGCILLHHDRDTSFALHAFFFMMTSSNGNIFRVTGPFVRRIHRSAVNSPHKGQWRRVLMFSLICTWLHGWVNIREAGDLRRHRAHYDVNVMWRVHCTIHCDTIRWTNIYRYNSPPPSPSTTTTSTTTTATATYTYKHTYTHLQQQHPIPRHSGEPGRYIVFITTYSHSIHTYTPRHL